MIRKVKYGLSALLVYLTIGQASAGVDNCPFGTTGGCVNWLGQSGRGNQWTHENNRYWYFYGAFGPYVKPLSLKIKLLQGSNYLHVYNGNGEQNTFPTRLMYAYTDFECSTFNSPSCIFGGITTAELAFEVVAHGYTHMVNLHTSVRRSVSGTTTTFCTEVGGESTCHTKSEPPTIY